MPAVNLTNALRTEYDNLFNTCVISAERVREIDGIVSRLMANKHRYEQVASAIGIPWAFVAVIHNMEASLDFSRHLHNGDPLTARTKQVPAGRPKTGSPPFTWEESAADALTLRKLDRSTDWSMAGTLYQLEGYNGWGYRRYHPQVKSPYLWGFSNHYTSGKYVADGTWSDTAISKQCGAAVLLRRLTEHGAFAFVDQPAPDPEAGPMVVSYSMRKPRKADDLARVEELQRWLNTFPGIFVRVDGAPGERTSDAYRKVTGAYLPGDPRIA